jgi:hypothetical protein
MADFRGRGVDLIGRSILYCQQFFYALPNRVFYIFQGIKDLVNLGNLP